MTLPRRGFFVVDAMAVYIGYNPARPIEVFLVRKVVLDVDGRMGLGDV